MTTTGTDGRHNTHTEPGGGVGILENAGTWLVSPCPQHDEEQAK